MLRGGTEGRAEPSDGDDDQEEDEERCEQRGNMGDDAPCYVMYVINSDIDLLEVHTAAAFSQCGLLCGASREGTEEAVEMQMSSGPKRKKTKR